MPVIAFLFVVIIVISFVLALRSMRNYLESPKHFKAPYAVYLIQKPQMLDAKMVEELYKAVLPSRSILSFERLFKGSRRALVLFGPTETLSKFSDTLGLLELEDYTKRATLANITGWEVGGKFSEKNSIKVPHLIHEIPPLEDNEEFWWQLCLHPTQHGLEKTLNSVVQGVTNESYRMALERQKKSTKEESKESKESEESKGGQEAGEAVFSAVIRAIVSSADMARLEGLKKDLSTVGQDSGLIKLPQVYTSKQVVDLYQQRALPLASRSQMDLSAEEIISLLGVN